MKSFKNLLMLIVFIISIFFIQNCYAQYKNTDLPKQVEQKQNKISSEFKQLPESDRISRWKQGQIYEFSNPHILEQPGAYIQFNGTEKVYDIMGEVFGKDTRVLFDYDMKKTYGEPTLEISGYVKSPELYAINQEPAYSHAYYYATYTKSAPFDFWDAKIKLSDIKFIDIKDPITHKTPMSIRSAVEPEVIDGMNYKLWRPMYYSKNRSEFIFWADGKFAILNLQTGTAKYVNFASIWDMKKRNKKYIFSNTLNEGLLINMYEKYCGLYDLNSAKTIDSYQYNENFYILDVYSAPLDKIYFLRYDENKIEIGNITSIGIKSEYKINSESGNSKLFALIGKSIPDVNLEDRIFQLRLNNNLVLIPDKYGSLYIFNLDKNGILERKYGFLQIKNKTLLQNDITYLKQFRTNPFTNKKFDSKEDFDIVNKITDGVWIYKYKTGYTFTNKFKFMPDGTYEKNVTEGAYGNKHYLTNGTWRVLSENQMFIGEYGLFLIKALDENRFLLKEEKSGQVIKLFHP